MVVLWQKKHLANIPTSKIPTSANSSEWTQQNQTLAEKRCCGSIQYTGSWGTKPFSPPCLESHFYCWETESLLIILAVNLSLPPAPSTDSNTSLSTHNTPVKDMKRKNLCSSNLPYCMELFLLYSSVILASLGELVPAELYLCPVKAGLAPVWAYLRAWFWQTRSWMRCSRACQPRGCSCEYRCGKEWKAGDGRSRFSPCHPPWSQRRDIPPHSPRCQRCWRSGRCRSRSCSEWPRWRWRFGTRPSASGRAWGAHTGTEKGSLEKIHSFSSFGKTVPNTPVKQATTNKKAK